MKVLFLAAFLTVNAHATILLKDIGLMGLASHDMFAWDRKSEVNTENGRLDLSTIFDYNHGKRWKKGGNPKNGENAPVYTVTMMLVDFYKAEMKKGFSADDARRSTVKHFHSQLEESFQRMSGQKFPTVGTNAAVTNVEQAAMRGLHDVLPGKVKLFGRKKAELILTDVWKAKTFLNEKEMNQEIATFNGDYDKEYKNIKIPFSRKTINLKKVDGEFIEKFSPYKQAEMLKELAKVGQGEIRIEDVSFIHHLDELFSKGICSKGNKWISQNIDCQ